MFTLITRVAKQIRVRDELKFGNKLILISCQSTSLILFTFCAIITSQQYFGKPIQCIQDVNSDSAPVPESVMNSFCFISYTYSSVEFKGNGEIVRRSEDVKKHSYYPWVPILIFLQGISFMVPLMLYSVKENSFLLHYLIESTLLLKKDAIPSMARYISKRLNDFGSWTTSNLLSEITFLINIIGNFLLTDTFLGGNFMNYGSKVIYNKMFEETVFPKMTKCTFFKYGPSGTIENREALCLMTLNIINEKFYLFLWFWFIMLLLFSIIVSLERLFFVLLLLIRKKCKRVIKKLLASKISQGGFTVLIEKFSFSDWILFQQMKSHMDPKLYFKLLESIALEISEPHDLVSNGLDVNINFY